MPGGNKVREGGGSKFKASWLVVHRALSIERPNM